MAKGVISRESLWGMLCEAAEIEHNLMCCYLYAAFSLKDSSSGGISAADIEKIGQWRSEIFGVAIEEMAHLANVCNILSGLGAPAHFLRPNFPVAPGYHPAGVVVKLAPFTMETLEHFIYLERPETVSLTDGSGFEPERAYSRTMNTDRMTPVARDYGTVGQLYAAIMAGLEELAASIGEGALFVGDPCYQLSFAVSTLADVKVVRCLTTAREAIESIVVQGEGAATGGEHSHYQRFLAIREQYQSILAARPDFRPAYPSAHNPVMRRPPTPEGRVWISAEPAASLLDLANALYNHSLRCLTLGYAIADKDSQRVLIGASIELMHLLTPVAEQLARMRAAEDRPDCTAGVSFATLRSMAALPAVPKALEILAERIDDLASRSATLDIGTAEGAAAVALCVERLPSLAQRLRRAMSTEVKTAPALSPSIGEPANKSGPPPPERRDNGVEAIAGKAITLLFDEKRCIHARHCVLGQPAVFKANVEGPWIDPDAASAEALVTVAHMCPSGAVGYERNDGGAPESPPPVNLVYLRENGPLGFRADLVLDGRPAGMRATLCRCGASKNKPFCDGRHKEIEFQATGEPSTRSSEPLQHRDGPLAIEPTLNGPLVVSGNLEICSGTGRTMDRVTSARLCRCGGSANKPFCDNTHRTNGFKST
jgi:CDGSH-type Zn-finger protein/uncharacterized Fe-S cluster protein YjdI